MAYLITLFISTKAQHKSFAIIIVSTLGLIGQLSNIFELLCLALLNGFRWSMPFVASSASVQEPSWIKMTELKRPKLFVEQVIL